MNGNVVLALFVGVVVWVAGWGIALLIVEGLEECLREVAGFFIGITLAAAVAGVVFALWTENRRWR